MDNMNDNNEIKNINDENNVSKLNNLNENIENKDNEKEKIQEVKQVKKSNFVPSYQKAKKEGNVEHSKNKKEKNSNKEKKLKSKITVIIISLLLIAIISVISLVVCNVLNKVNISDYDKLMDDYGFNALYNNNTSNPSEKVEKSEALKVIMSVALNTTDITEYMPTDMMYESTKKETTSEETDSVNLDELFGSIDNLKKNEEKYKTEYYVRYAMAINFFNKKEITEQNFSDKITYIDAIRYLSYAKTKILGKNLDVDNIPSFKNYESFNNEQKWVLADAVYNGIIKDSKSKFNGNEKLTKKQLNEMIINFVLKYNLITINDEKININEDKMPSNKNDFPYTLSSIKKDIYEIPICKVNENYKTPREIFSSIKTNYESINQIVENYYNTLLNIDYETISKEDIYSKLIPSTMYITTEEEINSYIEYVKANKIKVKGTAKVQNPVIYFDGENYRVRTKLTYNIESAEELKNIFFKDVDTTYEKGEKVIYVDALFSTDDTLTNFYIVPTTIKDIIIKK